MWQFPRELFQERPDRELPYGAVLQLRQDHSRHGHHRDAVRAPGERRPPRPSLAHPHRVDDRLLANDTHQERSYQRHKLIPGDLDNSLLDGKMQISISGHGGCRLRKARLSLPLRTTVCPSYNT